MLQYNTLFGPLSSYTLSFCSVVSSDKIPRKREESRWTQRGHKEDTKRIHRVNIQRVSKIIRAKSEVVLKKIRWQKREREREKMQKQTQTDSMETERERVTTTTEREAIIIIISSPGEFSWKLFSLLLFLFHPIQEQWSWHKSGSHVTNILPDTWHKSKIISLEDIFLKE